MRGSAPRTLLGEGSCLMAPNTAPEAAPLPEAAHEIFTRLEARPPLEETEALLNESGTAR
jgi:hypothetical protein